MACSAQTSARSWHGVDATEVWHRYAGDRRVAHDLCDAGRTRPDVTTGQLPQLVVHARHVAVARRWRMDARRVHGPRLQFDGSSSRPTTGPDVNYTS